MILSDILSRQMIDKCKSTNKPKLGKVGKTLEKKSKSQHKCKLRKKTNQENKH